jgi:MFS transporter, ACS family, tartrate transporter
VERFKQAIPRDTTAHPVNFPAVRDIAAVGMFAIGPLFWTLPTAFLSGTAAAGGIALIN